MLVVNRETPDTVDKHEDIEIRLESKTKIKSARIGIILLSMVSVVIILLIICTYPLEKYQIMKYTQKEDLCDI